ncbi:ImmA/IrrE family metallo-endopeptidase [Corynebacterium sp. Q4381]|uniref:ImmA/IrrE family metallo-endopeptidase n=1 Tax=Corynebacterium sp. Marseille-Q4381 TaxID=3121597 RepID=UPI002FE5CE3B
MAAPVRIPIAKPVLDWAIARTGSTVEELARSSEFNQIENWVNGTSQPTIRQAEALAAKASVPYPLLLLAKPRLLDVQLPDFRTVGSQLVVDPSVELAAAIERAQRQLDWYLEYADEVGLMPPGIVGSATLGQAAESVAERVRNLLGWVPGSRVIGDQAIAALSSAIEESGVLVTRNSMVGNNSFKPLRVEEFRGFTLIQDGFALVFVNTRDAKSAQLFSLAHELGHAVLGAPGISNESSEVANGAPQEIERWCNGFAAAFLMPAEAVHSLGLPKEADLEEIQHAARRFGVSVPAFVYRLRELGLASLETVDSLLAEHAALDIPLRERSSGGSTFRNVKARTGERLLSALRDSMGTSLLPVRDALDLTGLSKRTALEHLFATLEEN